MPPTSCPLTGVRFSAFEHIHSRLARTRSAYWDAVYSGALAALIEGMWQPTGPPEKVIRSAIANAKKTVQRRASKTVGWQDAADQVPARDTTSARDASLEVFYMLRQAPGRDQAVLRMRLMGKADAEIAEHLGVSSAQVPVLHHRAVKRLRVKFRRTD
jgi:DNA-directed RNA polymerase specialized sigma24 family protein